MTFGDILVIAVLGLMVGSIIGGLWKDKKNGGSACSGCANYNTCRAHLGCSNNTSKK